MQALCLIIGVVMAACGIALAGRLLPCVICSLLGWKRAERLMCDLLMTRDISLRGVDGLVWLCAEVPLGILLLAAGAAVFTGGLG